MAASKLEIRSVSIEFIDPKAMRYASVGDWEISDNGALYISIADTGNWLYNTLVAIHEFVEVFLCTAQGITQKQVDRFDFAHQDDDDPGEHPKAPYHAMHMMAMAVEMMLATFLGVSWRPYSDVLTKTWKKTPKRKSA